MENDLRNLKVAPAALQGVLEVARDSKRRVTSARSVLSSFLFLFSVFFLFLASVLFPCQLIVSRSRVESRVPFRRVSDTRVQNETIFIH